MNSLVSWLNKTPVEHNTPAPTDAESCRNFMEKCFSQHTESITILVPPVTVLVISLERSLRFVLLEIRRLRK
jgi:hypothetical protein